MCSMPWQQVSILNENKEKTPQLQYESDVFSCHGRGNPAPSNFGYVKTEVETSVG